MCSINVSIQLGYKYLLQSYENLHKLFDKCQIISETSIITNLDEISLPTIARELSSSSSTTTTTLNSGKKSQSNRNKTITKNLAFPLQQFGWTLEILNLIYRNVIGNITSEEKQTGNINRSVRKILSSSCCVLFDLLNLLNTNQINKILSVSFIRGNILEMLLYSLKTVEFDQSSSSTTTTTLTTTNTKSKKSKNNKEGVQSNNNNSSSSNDSSVIEYSINRVSNDIFTLFKCLELSSSIYLHKYSLDLLQILLTACPSYIQSTIKLLTKILSSSILSENLSPESTNNLVSNILKLLIQITDESSNEDIKCPQIILEPYFHTYQIISFEKKLSLLNIITTQYDSTIIPICISLILSHSFISHSDVSSGSSSSSGGNKIKEHQEGDNENSEKEVFVLLSRAAQRKMNQIRRTSQSEEFFNMACQLHLQVPDISNQIYTLVSMTNIVKKLLTISLDNNNNGDNNIDVNDKVNIEFSGHQTYQFSAKQYVNYANSFFSNENSFSSNIPALIILQLEYILEFIENPLFHDNLLTLLFNNDSGVLTSFGHGIQQIFLSFSESLLDLLSYLTYLQHNFSSKKKNHQLTIHLNHQKVTISSKEFIKYSSNLCLNVVKSYQHLLDGPTFIVILQELLGHENLAVRQKSLEILSIRLQSLSKTRAKLDVSFFFLQFFKIFFKILYIYFSLC